MRVEVGDWFVRRERGPVGNRPQDGILPYSSANWLRAGAAALSKHSFRYILGDANSATAPCGHGSVRSCGGPQGFHRYRWQRMALHHKHARFGGEVGNLPHLGSLRY